MDRHDIPTAVAIGFTISVLSTFGHEALGHGTACVLVRCVPIQVSSTYFLGDKAALSSGAIRAISLGGTIFNLVLGLVFLAALQIVGTRPEKGRVQTSVVPARRYYVLWFGAMSNLVSASGYILFGSAFRFGDYATILEGTGLPVRIGCVGVGGAMYLGSLWVAARLADPLLGSGKDRRGRLFALVLLPKAATSAVLSGSALLSPYPEAALFSFIGHLFPAIGAWGMLQWFVGDGTGEPAQPIARSRSWWVTSAVVAMVAVGVLGPGIPRSTRAELESLRGDLTDPSAVARAAAMGVVAAGRVLSYDDGRRSPWRPGAPDGAAVRRSSRRSEDRRARRRARDARGPNRCPAERRRRARGRHGMVRHRPLRW